MANEKTYIEGTSCKAINGQFGEFFNISINVDKIKQYANEKGYVNMTMSKRKEVGQYGDTHYFTLNTWKPENNDNSQGQEQGQTSQTTSNNTKSNNSGNDDISIEDIPF